MKFQKLLSIIVILLFAITLQAQIHTDVDQKIKSQDGQTLQFFPYKHIVASPWSTGVQLLRIMVAPWGRDDSTETYGFTWAKPFKTITGALNWIPKDLRGYETCILIHGGHYNNGIYPTHRFSNGRINLMWCGTSINSGSGIWATWIKAGATNPILNDSAVYVYDTLQTDCVVLLQNDEDHSGFTWTFRAYDFDTDTPYDNKWIVDGRIGDAHSELFCIRPSALSPTFLSIADIGYMDLYLGKTTGYGVEFAEWSSFKDVYLKKLRIIGGTGTASTGNSIWTTGFWIQSESLTLNSCKIYGVTSGFVSSTNLLTSMDMRGLTVDSGAKSTVSFYNTYQGIFQYDTASFNFTDNSTGNHTIRMYNGANLFSVKTYIAPNFTLMNDMIKLTSYDSTRTFGSVSDSIKVKINFNGIDYWLKLTK